MADSVRLDVWLDVACLFKTRSEAHRACANGKVVVDGVVAKAHRTVHAGDVLVILRPGGRRQTVAVRALLDRHVAKAVARELYEDRTPPPTAEEVEMRRLERLFKATTRPTPRLNRRNQRTIARRKWTT